jgi:hypothetical protein
LYCFPGAPAFTLKGINGLQLYVLGPPEDEKLIKKDLSKKEVYHSFLSGMGNSFVSALPTGIDDQGQIDRYLPFDKCLTGEFYLLFNFSASTIPITRE